MEKRIEEYYLLDIDCVSYYPSIILTLGLSPNHIGNVFLEVYENLVKKRIDAKKSGDKVTADSLKISINGSFGKTANKYSCIYSPDIMITITLTGQLALLMLIERIELSGIPVVSANTDGILVKCPKSRYDELNQIIATWEKDTGFETEETRYKAIYFRDVNNYIAIKENGECKTKGAYSEKGSSGGTILSKNPQNLICNDAVMNFLTLNKPIEETIMECKNVRRFVTVRRVKGGAVKDGIYLGRVVRWYYAKGEYGTINYKITGNKVPESEGGKPLMELNGFPFDIDYFWYIRKAKSMLEEIAFYGSKKTTQLKLF